MQSLTVRAAAIGAALAVLTGGYTALDIIDVVPGVLTRDTRAAAPDPATDESPDPAASPNPSATSDGDAIATLGGGSISATLPPLPALRDTARRPTPAGVTAAIAPLLTDPALGPSVGLDVRDGLTGERIVAKDPGTPRTPASTTKLLTAAAVTHATDASEVFRTRAVLGGDPSQVVLVAGGDTLLSPGKGDPHAVAGHAGLADLAARTAQSLRALGTTKVRVLLDDSFARGPALAPEWAAPDVSTGLTGPVTMLGTTQTRAFPGHPAPTDPALTATSVFASELVKAGIDVVGRLERAVAPPQAVELGSVESAPRGEVLALALDESDNALTESLARSAAAESGQDDLSFAAVAAWVETQLADQGIATGRLVMADTSGLSRSTRAPVRAVADVLVHGSTGESPALESVVARLPVAALDGTLHDRFHAPDAKAGRGLVRAKTGTLTGVNALGGTVVDADGRLLVFAVIADRAGGTLDARAALDRVAARLAACGCR